MTRFLSEDDKKIIRNAIGKPLRANCYLSYHEVQKKIMDGEMDIFSHKDIVVLVHKMRGMYKMYYFLNDSRRLSKNVYRDLYEEMLNYNILLTDIIARGENGRYDVVKNMGFNFYKKYFRLQLSVDKEKIFPLTEKAVFADETDCEEIYELLYSSFDVLSDHLLTKEELNHSLLFHQVIKICRDKKLAGVLIFEKYGVKSYLRALCVNPIYRSRDIGFSLVNSYIDIHRNESQSFYLWVESTNQNAIRLYEKFGYRHDGLIDCIYLYQHCAHD